MGGVREHQHVGDSLGAKRILQDEVLSVWLWLWLVLQARGGAFLAKMNDEQAVN